MSSSSTESPLDDLIGSQAAQLSFDRSKDIVEASIDVDIEEGELEAVEEAVEEAQLGNNSAKKKRSARKTAARKKRQRMRKEGNERRDEIEIENMLLKETRDSEKIRFAEMLIEKLIGDKTFIYLQERNSSYLNQLFVIEDSLTEPLSSTDPEFMKLNTVWIFKPGTHLVFDKDTMDLVLIVKIERVLMDYTTCVTRNTTNASQVVSHSDRVQNKSSDVPPMSNVVEKPHGVERLSKKPRQRFGKMFGAGWHASMEKGKVVVAYAPKQDLESVRTYDHCVREFPKVAQLYRDRLLTLFPAGGKIMDEFAVRNRIPSFAAMVLDGEDGERPFGNSLTITRDDFSNYQHQDFDQIQIAFGLWWAAKREKVDGKEHFSLDKDVDHDKVKGGEFLCSSYGIGVNFEQCKGLVQIEWRGKFDYHGTTKSQSEANVTRFGTSVQLTEKGTSAVNRFWGRGAAASLVVTPEDRVASALLKLKRRHK
ncbi:hypothetical protein H0H93_013323 [Arthromyces matolae]|nr:hypothetical protein H0H93_013323 [Arthromyces matolae]